MTPLNDVMKMTSNNERLSRSFKQNLAELLLWPPKFCTNRRDCL